MGYRELDVKMPASAGEGELKVRVGREAGVKNFTFTILKKSLDARKKNQILWVFRVGVSSPEIKSGQAPEVPTLHPRTDPVPPQRPDRKVLVVGTGPAGIFAADYLSYRGFQVTVVERGSRVEDRKAALEAFEAGGDFPEKNNYSFGEGGAGTFSDGKLSSRTKTITPERNWVFQRFVEAGGPEEIFYMTHPHLGSDRLFTITGNLRRDLENRGVIFHFDTLVTDLLPGKSSEERISGVMTHRGPLEADHVIMATGHSAFETIRMLVRRGLDYRPKNFALGFRAEHTQETINRAQWGLPAIPGVKAAEYRLTSQTETGTGVYSFCMCPGGTVVPAAAYRDTNLVNGMSLYARNGRFANAAVVAGLHIGTLLGREVGALEALDWLENLERSYLLTPGSYRAPAMTVGDFLGGKAGSRLPDSSYPLGLEPADLGALLPPALVSPLREGLADFCRKLRGYEEGIILGLESKTSAPVQVTRHPEELWSRFTNLYVAGEGSGWSGGIVSSAADGIKVARKIGG